MTARLVLAAAALLTLGACVATAPEWESRFGEATRQGRALQTIDPDAPSRHTALPATDGKAVAGALGKYSASSGYTVKEPQQQVLTIGGPGSGQGR